VTESPLLEMQLRSMHLPTVLANYRRLLGDHADPLPYLSDLISLESAKRQENGVRARITAAHFPTIKTIESFDFTLQPELPKAKLLEHLDGAFVDAHRNVIFSGPPGVGKSHILSALGLAMFAALIIPAILSAVRMLNRLRIEERTIQRKLIVVVIVGLATLLVRALLRASSDLDGCHKAPRSVYRAYFSRTALT